MTFAETKLKEVLEKEIAVLEYLLIEFRDKPLTPAMHNLMDMDTEEFREYTPETITELKSNLHSFNEDVIHYKNDCKLKHREW